MNKVKWLIAASGLLLLTGCAANNTVKVPIEDRSETRAREQQLTLPVPGLDQAEPAEGVTVVPLDTPVVRTRPEARTQPDRPQQANTRSWGNTPTAVAPSKMSPAVLALLDNADLDRRRGNYQSAENTLGRAQRIAPREPEVYYRMAQVRQKKRLWQQAEQLALRGVALAQGQGAMLKRLWLLIADIRLDAGDQTGAQKARLKANRY
ncbi:tetratricopeptide repeat protein [Marinobacterium jannaschii]|uniref:tetratricopeptide repeat protein n=1 Tax=Marinobacterium jannaschii TaxID=64970 RepID=UPI000685F295|nr:hypothetical protein [Marinobacterium jannaschii]